MTTPDAYNTALYTHGAVMILGFLIPGLTGFAANYLVPVMIGAKDVAFPRINALSVWLFWCGVILALLTFVIPDKPDVMWTGYPPYSIKTAGNTALYVFTVHLIGFSSILGAVNFITTIIYMRAPGMGWNQLNMFVWSIFTGLIIQLIFVPVLASRGDAAASGQICRDWVLRRDKRRAIRCSMRTCSGSTRIRPCTLSSFRPRACSSTSSPRCPRKPSSNYKAAVYGGMCGLIVMGGDVWIHHLYVAGMPNWLRIGMALTTLMISLPVGLLVLSLWGTIYKGAITYNVAMRYAALCFVLILLGGLTGIPLAVTSITVHFARTSFVHAHFHFIMGLFATYALFAAVYFWFPAITGRTADNAVSKLAFWFNAVGTQLTFWPLFIIGVDGMPRRYWDYSVETVGAARATDWDILSPPRDLRRRRHGDRHLPDDYRLDLFGLRWEACQQESMGLEVA